MRATEFIVESNNIISIGKQISDGSLEGYVVDTSAPQLKNYLQSQHAASTLINGISNQFSKIGIVKNLYVDEESRGQGIGNELMSHAIDRAFNEGAEAILLISDSEEENQFDLTNWYEGFGFEVIGNAAGNPVMILK